MQRRYTDQDIIDAVARSFSVAHVLRTLGLSPTGANYKAMYGHIARLGLDRSHFTGQGHLKGKQHTWTPGQPLVEILVSTSSYTNTGRLKTRLIRAGLLAN